MTVDELERHAYIEPKNLAVQRAYVQRCMDEVEHLRGEVARLDEELSEAESVRDEAPA